MLLLKGREMVERSTLENDSVVYIANEDNVADSTATSL